MREIKFRCYDKNEKYMLPWEHLVDAGDLSEMLKFGHKEDTDYSKLMQCTRIKDKNGVEIYEGDIYENPNGALFKIYYEPQEAAYLGVSLNRNYGIVPLINISGVTKGKVIGNIYEHPHLLEEDE